ncbi:putative colanic acid biosynthesis acetyltransferase [Empedobacter sp.]|uniref:putative colanic acid biosynthesis acetyltransferase n=1 Tax=Empedobacter sp. TaxID=1927715 RepID=UPI0028A090EA|nr:putative colanic acid biosynthesis acetyltransferase [Empedobacter sp.]
MNDLKMSDYKNNLSIKNKIERLLWNIFSVILFKPFGLKIFRKWRIFVLNCFGAKVHYSSLVFASANIWKPSNLIMEEYTVIGANVNVYNVDKIILKKNAIVSQFAYLCTASHDITLKSHPLIHKPIIINANAWVSADAFIGMGVSIGMGAVVGARAAVFKDVEEWSIVGGNPAKFIKKRVLLG